MKKCIIIPDSFKGTMSALEFCQIAEKTVKRHMPGCEVLTIPVADGGEGTVDCFVCALGAEKIERSVCGPWLQKHRHRSRRQLHQRRRRRRCRSARNEVL